MQEILKYIIKSKERQITAASDNNGNIRVQNKTLDTRKKKPNYLDISSDKMLTFLTKWLGPGKEKETLKEKVNYFQYQYRIIQEPITLKQDFIIMQQNSMYRLCEIRDEMVTPMIGK